jgi:hypothetical protein
MHLPISINTSRRQTLGLALLSIAGLNGATTAQGKNRKKKKKDTCDRKVANGIAQACGSQFDSCVTNTSAVCTRHRDPPACQAQVNACCAFMGRCEMPDYLTCIATFLGQFDPP